MRLISILLLIVATLVGCQARPTSGHAASAPKTIAVLTNQTVVYSCPQCGMDYDGPGKCSMCDVDLVKTQVAYICPADDKPVERSGKCPRCGVNARVVKTAVAAESSAPAPGGVPRDAANSGTSGGS